MTYWRRVSDLMEIMGFPLPQFFGGVLSIMMINLVLAGDNAIVIGLACRNLPAGLQLKAIFLGTVGAVVVRVLATVAIAWLLQMPGILLGGGLLLIWIAYKLLTKPQNHDSLKCYDSLPSAVATIILADTVMGVDNMLAVAGASQGNYVMIMIGLAVSIPIMVFGSTLIIKLVSRFPLIIEAGAAIIAYTAGKMITEEPLLYFIFKKARWKYLLIVLVTAGVLAVGRCRRQTRCFR